jgi:putative flippase GtrA
VQFIKYALAGGIATVVHVSLFYLCALKLFPALGQDDAVARLLHVNVVMVSDAIRARNSMLDNGVAFLFSNMTAYLINICWVFESGRHHRALEILYFYAVSGISLVLGSALMGFLIHHFGLMTTIAFASNAVVSLVINFVVRKFLIFKG